LIRKTGNKAASSTKPPQAQDLIPVLEPDSETIPDRFLDAQGPRLFYFVAWRAIRLKRAGFPETLNEKWRLKREHTKTWKKRPPVQGWLGHRLREGHQRQGFG